MKITKQYLKAVIIEELIKEQTSPEAPIYKNSINAIKPLIDATAKNRINDPRYQQRFKSAEEISKALMNDFYMMLTKVSSDPNNANINTLRDDLMKLPSDIRRPALDQLTKAAASFTKARSNTNSQVQPNKITATQQSSANKQQPNELSGVANSPVVQQNIKYVQPPNAKPSEKLLAMQKLANKGGNKLEIQQAMKMLKNWKGTGQIYKIDSKEKGAAAEKALRKDIIGTLRNNNLPRIVKKNDTIYYLYSNKTLKPAYKIIQN